MGKSFDVSMISWRIARIGGVLRSLLMFVCAAVLLVGAALVLEPTALIAITRPPAPVHSSQQTRNEFVESMASLIENGKDVLAVNSHSPTSQASVVVWMNDDVNPGVIDPQELAVISHNQLLRTITVYSLESTRHSAGESDGSPGAGMLQGLTKSANAVRTPVNDTPAVTGTPTHGRPAAVRLSGPLDRTAISAPVFCDRWRATPSVEPRTIATGISDMRVEPMGPSQNEFSHLRLWLRWSADSADGPGEATALIQLSKE